MSYTMHLSKEAAAALTTDPQASCTPGAGFDCEEGAGQQTVGEVKLSWQKKHVVFGAMAVAFCAALMLGFFVLGPIAEHAITADPEMMDHGHGHSLGKFAVGQSMLSPMLIRTQMQSPMPSVPIVGASGSSAPRCCTASIRMGLSVGDAFPASALQTCGVKGKKAVVFFYGADDAPSCKKEISGFEAALGEFKTAGFTVVGVRNQGGAKDTATPVNLVIDVDDAMRKEIGIKADLFGALGGRETYVLDSTGKVASVFNSQFAPDKHVSTALEAAEQVPKGGFANPFESLFG